jgi:hypothetical protein
MEERHIAPLIGAQQWLRAPLKAYLSRALLLMTECRSPDCYLLLIIEGVDHSYQ